MFFTAVLSEASSGRRVAANSAMRLEEKKREEIKRLQQRQQQQQQQQQRQGGANGSETLGTLTITIGITWINDFGIKIEGKFKNRHTL